jgi:ferredoxin-type protein NapF
VDIRYSRRSFLTAGRAGREAPLRPPWAVAGFLELCERCGDCLRACPEGVLVAGPGGYPAVDFARGACSFCGACRAACAPGALGASAAPWAARARLLEACLTRHGVLCALCCERCPEGAVRLVRGPGGVPRPWIDEPRCTGCGGCVHGCPAAAVVVS